MSRARSFKLTISNNATEKQGINYLINEHTGFFKIDLAMKKNLLEMLDIPKNFLQSFDMIYIAKFAGMQIEDEEITTNFEEILFVELKTTKKRLPENPKGFFFGATENEFKFGKLLGDKFRFCFVSLHPESLSYAMLTIEELEKIIRNKRIQYQINL